MSREKISGAKMSPDEMNREKILTKLAQRCSHVASSPGAAVALSPSSIKEWQDKLVSVETSLDVVDSTQSSAEAVAHFLAEQDEQSLVISPDGRLSPAIAFLQEQGLSVEQRAITANDQSVLTLAYAGVIETGSLVLLSSPGTPAENNFLPENAIICVYENRLVPDLESLWQLMDTERVAMPRAVNIISGPSKTADIEQTLVYGAHGPKQLHVILLRGEQAKSTEATG